MPASYSTPGVYIEEIATAPASVVQVPSAVPAFIGYTAKGSVSTNFLRINSLHDYAQAFGGETEGAYLHASIKLFYANGGGTAYVCSLGAVPRTSPSAKLFTSALTALADLLEPTLIVMPDAVTLGSGLADVQNAALDQCGKVGNRFCILDVPARDSLLSKSSTIDTFRGTLTSSSLRYGAVYGPWLQLPAAPPTPGLARDPIEIPASGAIAGIYVAVDAQRGVWKAPANVGVSGVAGLTENISDAAQQTLNVDADTGKSINVIRAFPGKGIVVWGARTLAGNDNEWRYVPVRRLFSMVEESIKRATAFVVFEPNDANTWVKVKAMIENLLSDLWRQGALAGAKPEDAFFVNVGLGTTMTTDDIIAGRIVITVGLAAVRPAEFIILRFSHKLQSS
jgi:hypothetical protein